MTLEEVLNAVKGLETFYRFTYQLPGKEPVEHIDTFTYADYHSLKNEEESRKMGSNPTDPYIGDCRMSVLLKMEMLPKEYAVDYHGKQLRSGDKVVLISYNNLQEGTVIRFTDSSVMIKETDSGFMRQINRLIANRKIYKL